MNWRGRWHYTYRVPQMWPQTIDCEIEWSTAHINSKLVAFTRATAGILQQTSRCTFHGSHNSAVTVNRTWSVSLSYATRRQDAHTTSKTSPAQCMRRVSGNKHHKLDAISHVSPGRSSSTHLDCIAAKYNYCLCVYVNSFVCHAPVDRNLYSPDKCIR